VRSVAASAEDLRLARRAESSLVGQARRLPRKCLRGLRGAWPVVEAAGSCSRVARDGCRVRRRERTKQIDTHGKEALNFQISMLIYNVVAAVFCLILIGFVFLAILGA